MQVKRLLNHAFNYVIKASAKYNIDESHALKHSMQVFYNANNIYIAECIKKPFLKDQEDIICVSSILHDMCDKKYVPDEDEGLQSMKEYMSHFMPEDRMNIACDIMNTMSYSKVKKNGYPDLGEYQWAYHIVREADLLAAYDPDRCIMYSMMVEKCTYLDAVDKCIALFNERIFKHLDDNLFVTDYGKEKAEELHANALVELKNIRKLTL